MIVVFVSHTHPPLVFETTPALLMAHAMDTAESTGTAPRAGSGPDMETAWTALTQDMKSAHRFEDVAAARAHFEADEQLPLRTRSLILSALDRQRRTASNPVAQ
jgi:hypothetical protein